MRISEIPAEFGKRCSEVNNLERTEEEGRGSRVSILTCACVLVGGSVASLLLCWIFIKIHRVEEERQFVSFTSKFVHIFLSGVSLRPLYGLRNKIFICTHKFKALFNSDLTCEIYCDAADRLDLS